MDTTTLLLSLVFGSVGLGLFLYGKNSQKMPHLIAGLALMTCPYFISNLIVLSIVCVILAIVPFVVRT